MCFRILPIAREYDRVIPYPGVLLFRLSPESSCILSARLRIIIVFLQVLVTWAVALINTFAITSLCRAAFAFDPLHNTV